MKRIKLYLFILISLLIAHSSLAENQSEIITDIDEKSISMQKKQEFKNIVNDIYAVEKSIEEVRKRRSENSKNSQALLEIDKTERQLLIQLSTLNQTIEQLVTGPAKIDLFLEKQSAVGEFNWRQELKEIVKPIFSELRRLTEKPRQIEAYREQETVIQERLNAANIALNNLTAFNSQTEVKTENSVLKELIKKWTSRKKIQERELLLIQYQLEQKLDEQKKQSQPILKVFEQFFTGSGFHFILALVSFFVTFFLLKLLVNYLSIWVIRNKNKDREERRFYTRLINLFSQVCIVLLSIAALLVTLVMLGDRVLLGLSIVLIIFMLFSLRNSLPGYFGEIRTLMNVGSARENERILYNGIPWKLVKINFYSILVNPRLTGGRIRLPLKIVTNLISRPNGKGEAWFPTRSGDFVILNDGTYGKVRMQTPEIVSLSLFDRSDKTYPTADFISTNPRNLSDGFGLNISFGLDYALQSIITTDVLKIMQESLETKMRSSDFANEMQSCLVEFKEAGASSLDVALIVIFSSEADSKYLKIERFIKSVAVDICNEQQWSIPFSQLTVHMAEQDSK